MSLEKNLILEIEALRKASFDHFDSMNKLAKTFSAIGLDKLADQIKVGISEVLVRVRAVDVAANRLVQFFHDGDLEVAKKGKES